MSLFEITGESIRIAAEAAELDPNVDLGALSLLKTRSADLIAVFLFLGVIFTLVMAVKFVISFLYD